MKLLVVCQYYAPEPFNVDEICAGLVEAGHEVTVLTGLPNYPTGLIPKEYRFFRKRRQELQGVRVLRTWLIGRRKGKRGLVLNYLSFALSATLRVLFMSRNFDLVLVYQLSPVTMAIPGIVMKKVARIPLLLYCFDLWPESVVPKGMGHGSRVYAALLRMTRRIYKPVDAFLVSSSGFSSYLVETLLVSKEIRYLPSYAEDMFSAVGYLDNGVMDFVFAGNVGHVQGVGTIMEAAALLGGRADIRIHIVGGGSALEACKEQARRMDLGNVVFHGQQPLQEMPAFYELADAFLVTLKDQPVLSMTLPRKVQSYMAAGKPIVAAINGETARVINEAACGLCGAAEDAQALAGNIVRLAEDRERAFSYGRNARAYYLAHFTRSIFMKRLIDSLESMVGQGKAVQGRAK